MRASATKSASQQTSQPVACVRLALGDCRCPTDCCMPGWPGVRHRHQAPWCADHVPLSPDLAHTTSAWSGTHLQLVGHILHKHVQHSVVPACAVQLSMGTGARCVLVSDRAGHPGGYRRCVRLNGWKASQPACQPANQPVRYGIAGRQRGLHATWQMPGACCLLLLFGKRAARLSMSDCSHAGCCPARKHQRLALAPYHDELLQHQNLQQGALQVECSKLRWLGAPHYKRRLAAWRDSMGTATHRHRLLCSAAR